MAALVGKAIVVTGAGRGLGRAYAEAAAREGASVIVNDVDRDHAEETAAAIRAEGGRAVARHDNIGEWDEAQALIVACVAEFGRLDGLVNNAGIFYMAKPEQETRDRVNAIIQVNVLGTAYCGIHALKKMRAQGSGAVVNVTSGAHAGYADMAMYGASKGAVASMTYSWASDVAGSGIRVNAIAPIAKSRMYEQMLEYQGGRNKPGDTSVQPQDNAAIVVFLLSDLASGVNGQIVRVDAPRLSIVTHPGELLPSAACDNWTVEDVRRAFEQEFNGRLQPLGLSSWRDASAAGSTPRILERS